MEIPSSPRPVAPDLGVVASRFVAETSARARRGRVSVRRTRIVATIGPASDDEGVLKEMAIAGMDVARIPLAHGTLEDAIERVRRIRSVAPEIGILADLPGPKIRTTPFPEGGVVMAVGEELEIVSGSLAPSSSAHRIGVALEGAVEGLLGGDVLAFGDGGLSVEVTDTIAGGVRARVRSGGHLQGRPGVSVPEDRVALSTPTEDDLRAAVALAEEGVDFIAVSFVRAGRDMEATRAAIGSSPTMLVSKIETRDGVANLEEILRASDAVMVARGDLGVRLPLEEIPHLQKTIIRDGVRFGLPVITATQMLESMISSPVPTRAEVTDVANAVLDGTSAVMLSAETAIGAHPVEVISTMDRIVRRTERDFDFTHWGAGLGLQEVSGDASSPARITAAITGAAWRAAIEEDAAAIIACTRNGATARAIARFRPAMPVVAATPLERSAHQLQLSWGVQTLVVPESTNTDDIVWFAVKAAVEAGYATLGDVVVVLAGSPTEATPVTDTLRLVRVR
jgi:pyruvate kinase